MGAGPPFRYDDSEAVFDELRRASAGGPADYSGISYERIDREDGVVWPCPAADHPGTPRLFEDRFPTPTGRARFHAVAHQPAAEEPDAAYPLYLTTGRLLAHYQTGSQTHRVSRLESISPRPVAQIHPHTAQRHGISAADEVTFSTRRAVGLFRVEIDSSIRMDTVFLPFHWGGLQSANRLTNPALDPISKMPEFKVCAVRIDNMHSKG
jgi:assimilatory nitrate reductase catalytic subunit